MRGPGGPGKSSGSIRSRRGPTSTHLFSFLHDNLFYIKKYLSAYLFPAVLGLHCCCPGFSLGVKRGGDSPVAAQGFPCCRAGQRARTLGHSGLAGVFRDQGSDPSSCTGRRSFNLWSPGEVHIVLFLRRDGGHYAQQTRRA